MEELLARLNLSQLAAKFQAEDIDVEAATMLSEDELKDLGLTLGARKKLYDALHPSVVAKPAASGSAAPKAHPPPAAANTKAPLPPPAVKLGVPKAVPVATPKATTVVTPPAAASVASAGPAEGKVSATSWRWHNDAQPWGFEGAFSRIRLEPGSDPQRFISSSRKENTGDGYSRVYDIRTRKPMCELRPSGENVNERFYDSDFIGDTLVTVGGEEHSCMNVFSINKQAQTGFYRGPNEGGLLDVALCTTASGALTAVSSLKGFAQLYDVATASRSGKFKLEQTDNYAEQHSSLMLRDPVHPGCFFAAFRSTKLYYADMRVGAASVRSFSAFENAPSHLRMPTAPGDKFIVTDRGHEGSIVRIFDLGTSKVVHTISAENVTGVAMYGNVAACCGKERKGGYYVNFYDLAGAGPNIKDPDLDLHGDSFWDLDMASKIVLGCAYDISSMYRP